MPKDERSKYMLKEEFHRFVEVCPLKYSLFWKIVFNAGLRISEGLNITTNDILYSENKLLIKTLKRKGHPIIPVIIPEYLINELKMYIQKNEIIDRIWPFSRQFAFKIFKQVCKKSGLNPKYSPHSFRHGHGVLVCDVSNGNIAQIQNRLRHADIKSTQFYIHISEKKQKELCENIERYLNEKD